MTVAGEHVSGVVPRLGGRYPRRSSSQPSNGSSRDGGGCWTGSYHPPRCTARSIDLPGERVGDWSAPVRVGSTLIVGAGWGALGQLKTNTPMNHRPGVHLAADG